MTLIKHQMAKHKTESPGCQLHSSPQFLVTSSQLPVTSSHPPWLRLDAQLMIVSAVCENGK